RRATFLLIMAAAVATGLAFGLDPQLDLRISALFYDPAQRTWPANASALIGHYRDVSSVVAVILVIIAVGALALAAIRRRAGAPIGPRAAALLPGSLALGPGLLTNVLLQPPLGRPPPPEAVEFGGRAALPARGDPVGG